MNCIHLVTKELLTAAVHICVSKHNLLPEGGQWFPPGTLASSRLIGKHDFRKIFLKGQNRGMKSQNNIYRLTVYHFQ